MNPATLLKARRLAVMPALDGSWRVGGDSEVYAVTQASYHSDRLYCTCRAGVNTTECSHRIAVRLWIANHNAPQSAREAI